MRGKGLVFAIILGVVLFGVARLYYSLTDDFRLANIHYDLPYLSEWEVEELSSPDKKAFEEIMKEPFSYLGKGAQVYAFQSQDKKYVLKFFKFKHIRPQFYLKYLPPIPVFNEYRERKTQEKLDKVKSIFKGYKIAYDHDKDHTGLIAVHLNRSNTLNMTVTIVDKIGRSYQLNLDDTVFVLQKKGITLRNQLSQDLNKGDLELAKRHIRQIFTMYLDEYSRGLYDRDHGVPQNTGFLGETPFHLDVGKFSYGDEYRQEAFYIRDLGWVAVKLRMWIQTKFPAYEKALTRDMENFISEKIGRPVDLAKIQASLPGGKKPPISP